MQRMKIATLAFGLAILLLMQVPQATAREAGSDETKNLPTPKEAFGFVPGTPEKLASYDEIVAYLEKLAAASPRMQLQRLGKTTEGNDFVMAIISAPENLKSLAAIRQGQARLADPRKTDASEARRIIRSQPVVVLVNCSIHSTEVGPAQMAPQLAYELCAGTDPRSERILKNVVTLLVPAHNPDGQKKVVEWYKKVKGTKYVSARPPFLYQKYVDHDNNRDWFMFTQAETRITVEKIHNVWRPQLTLDMHQMGRNGARIFVPPYIDPVEPNVDPILVAQIARAGSDVFSTLIAEGKRGVVLNAIFDAWTPARAYPHYHHGVRFLTEVASANLASSVTIKWQDLRGRYGYDPKRASWNYPAPWRGGKWTLKDIVEYNRSAALAVLDHMARNRQHWLQSYYEVARKAVAPKTNPYAFLIPPEQADPHAVRELVDILQTAMVEVHEARSSFTADGARYPKGTLVVKSAQPYGAFARAMLQRQHYPEIRNGGKLRRPYDVTAHTLPLFLGVDVVKVADPFKARLKLLDAPPAVRSRVKNSGARHFLLTARSNQSYKLVNACFKAGMSVSRLREAVTIGNETWDAGTFVISPGNAKARLIALAKQFGLDLVGTNGIAQDRLIRYRKPRLGVYKSYWPVIDEGWTRWVLEEYGFDYVTLRDKDIRAGHLNDNFDAIVLPSQARKQIIEGRRKGSLPEEYTGGIGEIGVRQLETFVKNGGTLLAFDRATALPIKEFYLPVQNIVANMKPDQFYCPGSVLRVYIDNRHPLGFGMPEQGVVLFVNSPVFQTAAGETIVSYPMGNPLLSGWLNGENVLFNKKAMLQIPHGNGRVILYGFRPQFRAQFRVTYKLFFNGILQSAAQ